MNLKQTRDTYTDNSTSGIFSVNGEDACYGLEPPVKPQISKAHPNGLCCIPEGIYQLTLSTNGSVWAWMKKAHPNIGLENGIPHIHNIAGNVYKKWHETEGVLLEQGVLIHDGNYETPEQDDSLGCLILGMERGTDQIIPGTSGEAFSKIYPMILTALKSGERVFIEFENGEAYNTDEADKKAEDERIAAEKSEEDRVAAETAAAEAERIAAEAADAARAEPGAKA